MEWEDGREKLFVSEIVGRNDGKKGGSKVI